MDHKNSCNSSSINICWNEARICYSSKFNGLQILDGCCQFFYAVIYTFQIKFYLVFIILFFFNNCTTQKSQKNINPLKKLLLILKKKKTEPINRNELLVRGYTKEFITNKSRVYKEVEKTILNYYKQIFYNEEIKNLGILYEKKLQSGNNSSFLCERTYKKLLINTINKKILTNKNYVLEFLINFSHLDFNKQNSKKNIESEKKFHSIEIIEEYLNQINKDIIKPITQNISI